MLADRYLVGPSWWFSPSSADCPYPLLFFLCSTACFIGILIYPIFLVGLSRELGLIHCFQIAPFCFRFVSIFSCLTTIIHRHFSRVFLQQIFSFAPYVCYCFLGDFQNQQHTILRFSIADRHILVLRVHVSGLLRISWWPRPYAAVSQVIKNFTRTWWRCVIVFGLSRCQRCFWLQ